MIKYASKYGYKLLKAKRDDIGFDVKCGEKVTLSPGETKLIDTGISLELPEGVYVDVRGKSGLSSKGILCHTGLVDTGYRNSIKVCLTNLNKENYIFEELEKIAQLVFRQEYAVYFKPVEEVDKATDRGIDGFGSTGRF